MEQQQDRAAAGCLGERIRGPADCLIGGDHDEVPQDGSWLYVVDRRRWDEGGEHGVWVNAEADARATALLVAHHLGHGVSTTDLAVVDQVGVDEMIDEDYFNPPRLV